MTEKEEITAHYASRYEKRCDIRLAERSVFLLQFSLQCQLVKNVTCSKRDTDSFFMGEWMAVCPINAIIKRIADM